MRSFYPVFLKVTPIFNVIKHLTLAATAIILGSFMHPAIADTRVHVCISDTGSRTIQDKPCAKGTVGSKPVVIRSRSNKNSNKTVRSKKKAKNVHPRDQKYNARRTDKLTFRQLVNLCRSLKQRQLDLSDAMVANPEAQPLLKQAGMIGMGTELVDHCSDVAPQYWARGYASDLPPG